MRKRFPDGHYIDSARYMLGASPRSQNLSEVLSKNLQRKKLTSLIADNNPLTAFLKHRQKMSQVANCRLFFGE